MLSTYQLATVLATLFGNVWLFLPGTETKLRTTCHFRLDSTANDEHSYTVMLSIAKYFPRVQTEASRTKANEGEGIYLASDVFCAASAQPCPSDGGTAFRET